MSFVVFICHLSNCRIKQLSHSSKKEKSWLALLKSEKPKNNTWPIPSRLGISPVYITQFRRFQSAPERSPAEVLDKDPEHKASGDAKAQTEQCPQQIVFGKGLIIELAKPGQRLKGR